MNYCYINPMQNNKMVNPQFCQQGVGSKNLIIASQYWNGSLVKQALYLFLTGWHVQLIKMAMLRWPLMYFFSIFVLVIECFDINLVYMELTVDNMDDTEAGSVTDLKIFCS